jgi:hypothetical protein
MASAPTSHKPRRKTWTVADLYPRFGPIAFEGIRHDPPPGTATVADVDRLNTHEDWLWYVRPKSQVVDVYTAPDRCNRLTASAQLKGGDVLHGFSVTVSQLFPKAKTSGSGKEKGKTKRRRGGR